jgi:hypothetical protein
MIPTAKELIGNIAFNGQTENKTLSNGIELLMIEFTKLHVEAMEKAIIKSIIYMDLSVDWKTFDKSGMLLLDKKGRNNFEKAIKNAYSIKNIR